VLPKPTYGKRGTGATALETAISNYAECGPRLGVENCRPRLTIGHRTRDRRRPMFKKAFELVTLKWLWDRRGGGRRR
jgi:hypothetical protein